MEIADTDHGLDKGLELLFLRERLGDRQALLDRWPFEHLRKWCFAGNHRDSSRFKRLSQQLVTDSYDSQSLRTDTKAAKQRARAQSAVTYGIQKLEAQFGIPLFDRTTYRPALTEAGRVLLPRARRIAEETNAFRDTARSLASGLEAELTIVLDSMFPMPAVVKALRAFTAKFPIVPPRVHVQSLGASAELVLDGTCMIGLLALVFSDIALLKRFPLLTIDLIPVVAPDHPLAALEGPIDTHVLDRHVQLVLTDRSSLTAGRDYGVLSGRAWRLADLGAKHSMLLAGLGWGNMPSHLVQNDIVQGRLKVIRPVEFDSSVAQIVMCGAYLADHRLGPAGQWIIDHLSPSSAVRHRTHASHHAACWHQANMSERR